MKIISIEAKDEGQRLDKLLFKYLKNAPSSFVYKMLRKKNIVLNNKKATGRELLSLNDEIKLFLSDDTIEKFRNGEENKTKENAAGISVDPSLSLRLKDSILYEDDNILAVNKWDNILSQKASNDDISLNELCLDYLIKKGEINSDSLSKFKPSICNRLDRNTTGVILFAKTYIMANALAKSLRERSTHKYYRCIVKGKVSEEITLNGYISKDIKSNTVTVFDSQIEGCQPVITKITPIDFNDSLSLLEIELITGKTHQIRAHLASIGHPIGGDIKYGSKKFNKELYDRFGVEHQLLHSYRTVMSKFDGILSNLSALEITAPLPKEFEEIINVCLEK